MKRSDCSFAANESSSDVNGDRIVVTTETFLRLFRLPIVHFLAGLVHLNIPLDENERRDSAFPFVLLLLARAIPGSCTSNRSSISLPRGRRWSSQTCSVQSVSLTRSPLTRINRLSLCKRHPSPSNSEQLFPAALCCLRVLSCTSCSNALHRCLIIDDGVHWRRQASDCPWERGIRRLAQRTFADLGDER